MKLALNGALTIGTLDGAKSRSATGSGADNIFIFGLTAEEIERAAAGANFTGQRQRRHDRRVCGGDILHPQRRVLARRTGPVSAAHRSAARLRPFHGGRRFRRLLDGAAHRSTRFTASPAGGGPAILNTARMGWFSSDRAVREYAEAIWGVNVDPT